MRGKLIAAMAAAFLGVVPFTSVVSAQFLPGDQKAAGSTGPAVSAAVVGVSASDTSSSSASVVLTAPVAAGDSVIVAVMIVAPAAPQALTVSDGSNRYVTQNDFTDRTKSERLVVLAANRAKALAVGSSVTITGLPASQGNRIEAVDITHLGAGDQHAGNFGANSSSAAFSSGIAPPTNTSSELLLGAVGVAGSTVAPSWSSGWTALQPVSAADNGLALATRQVSAADAYQASGTATGSWIAEMSSFTIESTAPAAALSSPCTASTCKTCNVTKAPFNADPTGQKDATLAIRKAIAACESSNGSPVPNVVWLPAGTYALNLIDNTTLKVDLSIQGPHPVILAGQGRPGDPHPTLIVQRVGVRDAYDCSYTKAMSGGCANNKGTCVPYSDPKNNTCWLKNIVAVQDGAAGSTIEDLGLDTYQYDAGTSLTVSSSNVTVSHISTGHRAAGGAGHPQFPIYYSGNQATRDTPCASHPASCHWNNVIQDLVAYDEECDDGIVLAMNGKLSVTNLRYEGSRVALYVDSQVTIKNFNYTPGIEPCQARMGFAETSPSDHITIKNYVDHNTARPGGNGMLGNSQAGHNYMTNTMKLIGYDILGSQPGTMSVKNVNNLTVRSSSSTACTFGPKGTLHIEPSTSISAVLVQGCTVPRTSVSLPSGASIQGGIAYKNDVFSKQSPQSYTFTDPKSNGFTVNWSGGSFKNCPNSGKYLKNSSAITVQVPTGATKPSGYPC